MPPHDVYNLLRQSKTVSMVLVTALLCFAYRLCKETYLNGVIYKQQTMYDMDSIWCRSRTCFSSSVFLVPAQSSALQQFPNCTAWSPVTIAWHAFYSQCGVYIGSTQYNHTRHHCLIPTHLMTMLRSVQKNPSFMWHWDITQNWQCNLTNQNLTNTSLTTITRSPASAGIANRPLVFLGIFLIFGLGWWNLASR